MESVEPADGGRKRADATPWITVVAVLLMYAVPGLVIFLAG